MDHMLHIELDHAEGAVRRVLGVVEGRGFEIRSISMDAVQAEAASMMLCVHGRGPGRDPDILKRQIARLYGVRRVGPDQLATTRSGETRT